jgi:hypothetical protein
MRIKKGSGLIVVLGMLAGLFCYAEQKAIEVIWVDFDMKNIPEPKERKSSVYDAFFKGQVVEGTKRDLDIPRWLRVSLGRTKQSANVNAMDEVPDSSWYTNRHYLRPMTIDELVRGPNRGHAPDLSHALITKAKIEGVSPGMFVKDANGDQYLIKFDIAGYENLQSGAEVISTKILYASGYNVPENYVAYLDPKGLEIGKDVRITDPETGQKRPLTRDDFDLMLRRVARTADGRCRVMASKILAGKPKGPFSQIGFRSDDPNDLIPHEDRRELRAFRVFASWINDWDIKEEQSLDMYVEEGGRKFLRHYLLDFGSSLGADTDPTEFFHSREYGLDKVTIAKEVTSLGFYKAPDEKVAPIISSEIGNFTSDDFDPERWKQTYPAIAFDNLTRQDAFWATRIILSFTEAELRSIVEAGQYRDSRTVDYILRTLLERRQKLARVWLSKVDALAGFSVRPTPDGVALGFHDLMLDNNLAKADSTEYRYQIRSNHYQSEKRKTGHPEIVISRAELAAAIERTADSLVEVEIWTSRQNSTSDSVRVTFDWSPRRNGTLIRRISRG